MPKGNRTNHPSRFDEHDVRLAMELKGYGLTYAQLAYIFQCALYTAFYLTKKSQGNVHENEEDCKSEKGEDSSVSHRLLRTCCPDQYDKNEKSSIYTIIKK